MSRHSGRLGAIVAALALWPAGGAHADACTLASQPGTVQVRTPSGGVERVTAVYFPAAPDGHGPLPLVIELHGSGSSGAAQSAASGLRALADRRRFIVASPDGGISFPDRPGAHAWNVPGVRLFGDVDVPPGAPDDVRFIADLRDQLVAAACVDPRRVYVTGMSGGGRMASALACRLADRIAAIAPVAGLRAGTARADRPREIDPASCAPQRVMPVLSFHGSDDPVNPFDGGGQSYWGYPVRAALGRWAELDGCGTQPVDQPYAVHVRRITYVGCRPGGEVTLYLTDAPRDAGGGHIWPGEGGSGSLDASSLIVDFFSRHALPRARDSRATDVRRGTDD